MIIKRPTFPQFHHDNFVCEFLCQGNFWNFPPYEIIIVLSLVLENGETLKIDGCSTHQN